MLLTMWPRFAAVFALGLATCETSETERAWMNCRAGDAAACTQTGDRLLADGKDPARAFEMYSRGCDGQQPRACLSKATMLLHGEGVATDVESAITLLARLCDDDELPDACALRKQACKDHHASHSCSPAP